MDHLSSLKIKSSLWFIVSILRAVVCVWGGEGVQHIWPNIIPITYSQIRVKVSPVLAHAAFGLNCVYLVRNVDI